MQLLVILPNDRVEDGPHHLREVNEPFMVPNIQAEDDLVQLALINVKAFVAERRRQLPHEVSEPGRRHVVLARLVERSPCFQEGGDIALLK